MLRGDIESSFERFGWWVIRWRWPTIVACLLLSFGLISGLQHFRIDNSDEAFLPADDLSGFATRPSSANSKTTTRSSSSSIRPRSLTSTSSLACAIFTTKSRRRYRTSKTSQVY